MIDPPLTEQPIEQEEKFHDPLRDEDNDGDDEIAIPQRFSSSNDA